MREQKCKAKKFEQVAAPDAEEYRAGFEKASDGPLPYRPRR
jgi:hypothetical protein